MRTRDLFESELNAGSMMFEYLEDEGWEVHMLPHDRLASEERTEAVVIAPGAPGTRFYVSCRNFSGGPYINASLRPSGNQEIRNSYDPSAIVRWMSLMAERRKTVLTMLIERGWTAGPPSGSEMQVSRDGVQISLTRNEHSHFVIRGTLGPLAHKLEVVDLPMLAISQLERDLRSRLDAHTKICSALRVRYFSLTGGVVTAEDETDEMGRTVKRAIELEGDGWRAATLIRRVSKGRRIFSFDDVDDAIDGAIADGWPTR